jgi:excisionase
MAEKLNINEKYMLRILEASEYYGIGIAEDGENIFAVKNDNRWMIHREKFNAYLEEHYFSGKEPEEDIPVKVF